MVDINNLGLIFFSILRVVYVRLLNYPRDGTAYPAMPRPWRPSLHREGGNLQVRARGAAGQLAAAGVTSCQYQCEA